MHFQNQIDILSHRFTHNLNIFNLLIHCGFVVMGIVDVATMKRAEVNRWETFSFAWLAASAAFIPVTPLYNRTEFRAKPL